MLEEKYLQNVEESLETMDRGGNKIVLIGDAGVGKTSMVYWFINKKALQNTNNTIGAAFSATEIKINDRNFKINIWDTAGQERFRSIAKMYYKNTIGCLCVFDLTNRDSFKSLEYWIDDYKHNYYCGNIDETSYKIVIVANKCDYAKGEWVVSEKEVSKFAIEHDCDYIYTSSATGLNIIEAFQKASMLAKYENNPLQIYMEAKQNNVVNLYNDKWRINTNYCKC